MNKPREFWIFKEDIDEQDLLTPPDSGDEEFFVHCREVMENETNLVFERVVEALREDWHRYGDSWDWLIENRDKIIGDKNE